MKPQTILFVSHPQEQCGVHQFGLSVARALEGSRKYRFQYLECAGGDDLLAGVKRSEPAAIIYNYYNCTLPWLDPELTRRRLRMPQAGIFHEVTQALADQAGNELFDFHIAADPTLLLINPRVFKTGRLLPEYAGKAVTPEITTIGTFGFGTPGKGFDKIVLQTQREYDRAIIRMHLPIATFGDAEGSGVNAVVQRCRELITKPGLELQVSHQFLARHELLDFLAGNTLNAFLYDDIGSRGISSVIDHALAVRRPIAVSRSSMFRHVLGARPSICVEDSSFHQIIANGTEPLRPYWEEWTEANLVWDYERIISNILARPLPPRPKRQEASLLRRIARKVKRRLGIPATAPLPAAAGDKRMGLENPLPVEVASPPPRINYSYETLPEYRPLNRILDDKAREQYQPAIDALFQLTPRLMERKIPRANIQQAFVFDTVLKFAAARPASGILCVGGFEDTAAPGFKPLAVGLGETAPQALKRWAFGLKTSTRLSTTTSIRSSQSLPQSKAVTTSYFPHRSSSTLRMMNVSCGTSHLCSLQGASPSSRATTTTATARESPSLPRIFGSTRSPISGRGSCLPRRIVPWWTSRGGNVRTRISATRVAPTLSQPSSFARIERAAQRTDFWRQRPGRPLPAHPARRPRRPGGRGFALFRPMARRGCVPMGNRRRAREGASTGVHHPPCGELHHAARRPLREPRDHFRRRPQCVRGRPAPCSGRQGFPRRERPSVPQRGQTHFRTG